MSTCMHVFAGEMQGARVVCVPMVVEAWGTEAKESFSLQASQLAPTGLRLRS